MMDNTPLAPLEPTTQPMERTKLFQEIERETRERLSRIDADFSNGFDVLSKHSNTITIFGSARFQEGHEYYDKARELAEVLADEGYTIITGGGGGIMEAGNRGAFEAGGSSIGFNIELPTEQALNPYTTSSMPFRYFFSRKVMLAFAAEAYIYFPGGFGTLDEFFEIMTLIQTNKIPRAPVICVGKDFWEPLDDFIRSNMLEGLHTISPDDEKIYTITDDTTVIKTILNEHERRKVTEILGSSDTNT